jgi:hypothetical protein
MLAFVLTAIVRFIADSTNPFFLMPAAEAFFKSLLALFFFGLIIRIIALF